MLKKMLYYSAVALLVNSFIASAVPVFEDSAEFVFPRACPGRTFVVRRGHDSETGKGFMNTYDGSIKSALDIEKMQRQEKKMFIDENGHVSESLANKKKTMADNDSIDVQIELKPAISQAIAMDITKDTIEDSVLANRLNYAMKAENENQKKYNLIANRLKKDYKFKMKPAMESVSKVLFVSITKKELEKICRDIDVISVEEIQPKKAAYSCSDIGGYYTNLKTLTNSAYNPPSGMVNSGYGYNVQAATIESGIDQDVIDCNRAHGRNIVMADTVRDSTNNHSNVTFECLANTAPRAFLYHRNHWPPYLGATPGGLTDRQWIINNNIKSIGTSYIIGGGPTTQNNREVDCWAYRAPFPVICNAAGNEGYCEEPYWQCYNAFTVGNVRDSAETHFMLPATTVSPCGYGIWDYDNPYSMARNPIMSTHTTTTRINCSGWGCSGSNTSGDWELPQIVAPGMIPFDSRWPDVHCFMTDSCLEYAHLYGGGWYRGTSFSAPIANGTAACVLSSAGRVIGKPEVVRLAMILTAQDVYAGYWNPLYDNIDGAGTISGSEAVTFVQNYSQVNPNMTELQAVTSGLCNNTISENTGSSYNVNFWIKIPNPKPSGKHLRIVLLWTSSPSDSSYLFINDLANLDLCIPAYPNPWNGSINWGSWDSNVEVAEIISSRLTAGSKVNAYIRVPSFTIQAGCINKAVNYIKYAIGWRWVADHAR